jgi:hypothetical protein
VWNPGSSWIVIVPYNSLMNAQRLMALIVTAILSGAAMADDSWIVREDGAGPAKIGMTLSQLNAVLHEKFAMPASKDEKDEKACFDVEPKHHPQLNS